MPLKIQPTNQTNNVYCLYKLYSVSVYSGQTKNLFLIFYIDLADKYTNFS